MFSIGILGFIVWSLLVGLFNSDIEVINFAVYWNSHFQIITNVLSENIIDIILTKSVRNDMYYSIYIIFFNQLCKRSKKKIIEIIPYFLQRVYAKGLSFFQNFICCISTYNL